MAIVVGADQADVLLSVDVCCDSDERKVEVDDISDAKLELDVESVVNAVKVVEMQIGTLMMFRPVHELMETEVVAEKHDSMTVEDSITEKV